MPEGRYFYSETYGWFDRQHLNTGNPRRIIDQVYAAIENGGGFVHIQQNISGGMAEYESQYYVSGDASVEQAIGIALGIYMDFSIRFETWEGAYFGLISDTDFAIEDLPSHYVGFYAAANDLSYGEVFAMLGGVEGTNEEPPRRRVVEISPYRPLGSGILNYGFGPGQTVIPVDNRIYNREFTPLLVSDGGWTQTRVAWPSELDMTPIDSSTNLWEFQVETTTLFGSISWWNLD